MKILQIIPALKSGGTERGTIDLCLDLKTKGFTPYVISNGGALVKELEKAHIPHMAWPVHKKNPFTILWTTLRLAQFIKKEKIDIVHARSRVPAWMTYFANMLVPFKWVTTCHGYYSLNFGSAVMGWADRVIVASDSIKDHMVHDFKVPPQKISFIPRGVDLNQFRFEGKKLNSIPTIGIIGRITPLKGHKVFLAALKELKDNRFLFKAEVVGEGPNKKYVEELLAFRDQLGLHSQVNFCGHQSDIPSILRGLDCLVLSTTTPEAFGRVIIEAQAVGVPVVASRVGGVTQVIEDHKTGLLYDPHDPKALAKSILEVFNDHKATQQRISDARKKVETHYSKELMVTRTIDVYKNLLDRKKILVIKLTSLGDMVLISPSLRALKQRYP